MNPTIADDVLAIEAALGAINTAWVEGRSDALEEHFHEDMMIMVPGHEERQRGRDTCIKGYLEFASRANLRGLDLGDCEIDVVGDTGVATYSFDIRYDMAGDDYHDVGTDVWVFSRIDGDWKAIWRTMIYGPAEEAGA